MDGDPVVVVLVEAHVGEELARSVLAERGVGERVPGVRASARLDVVVDDGHGARRDPRRAGDHPLPAVLDRLDAPIMEREMRLVVHAIHALDHSLMHLVDDLAALAGVGVDPVYPLVVHLHYEVLGPTAVAAKPAPYLAETVDHDDSIGPRPRRVDARIVTEYRSSAAQRLWRSLRPPSPQD